MHRDLQAIVFDLFGTLVHVRHPRVPRKVPRLLGVDGRAWMTLVREDLLLLPISTPEAFVEHAVEKLGIDCSESRRLECLELVRAELASVEPLPGLQSLLSFLKRRGYRLGLLSNLTGVHATVLDRLKLRDSFDAVCLSCDEGIAKPNPEIYRRLCERLGSPPETTLFVGDSLQNDVIAPQQLGMKALRIDSSEGPGRIPSAGALGWLDLKKLPEVARLIPFSDIRLDGTRISVQRLEPLSDEEQGRYNLVARAAARSEPDDATSDVFYCKRFLLPEAAYVEEFANQLLSWLELPSCAATVVSEVEPCLVSSAAPGVKLEHAMTPEIAYEVGRHGAASFIFANGDLRPRNAFVAELEGATVMTMVDLEHFFFNLAIDVEGLTEPKRPQTIDALAPDEIERRLRRKVLSERTTRRAMRSFLEIESFETKNGGAFREGWLSVYQTVKSRGNALVDRIRERVYREPYLIIGTHSYRRAMARIDIEDIRSRAELDPDEILPRLVAYTKSA